MLFIAASCQHLSFSTLPAESLPARIEIGNQQDYKPADLPGKPELSMFRWTWQLFSIDLTTET